MGLLATVITSLVTVIPVVGKHILYWLWGGFSILNHYVAYTSNSILKTLLVAGTSFERMWPHQGDHLSVSEFNLHTLLINLINYPSRDLKSPQSSFAFTTASQLRALALS